MKILQLVPRLASGGLERFVVDLTNELSRDHEVFLYTLRERSEDDLFFNLIKPKVTTGDLGMKGWVGPATILRLKKLIKNINPDIIHAHGRALHYLMPIKLFNKGLSIIYTEHTSASHIHFRSIEVKLFRYFFQIKRFIRH